MEPKVKRKAKRKVEPKVELKDTPGFSKVLAKYYRKWYSDCLESAEYCKREGRYESAAEYLKSAESYKQVIDKYTEAIDFFSQGDKAFLIDSALPEKFRGYK